MPLPFPNLPDLPLPPECVSRADEGPRDVRGVVVRCRGGEAAAFRAQLQAVFPGLPVDLEFRPRCISIRDWPDLTQVHWQVHKWNVPTVCLDAGPLAQTTFEGHLAETLLALKEGTSLPNAVSFLVGHYGEELLRQRLLPDPVPCEIQGPR